MQTCNIVIEHKPLGETSPRCEVGLLNWTGDHSKFQELISQATSEASGTNSISDADRRSELETFRNNVSRSDNTIPTAEELEVLGRAVQTAVGYGMGLASELSSIGTGRDFTPYRCVQLTLFDFRENNESQHTKRWGTCDIEDTDLGNAPWCLTNTTLVEHTFTNCTLLMEGFAWRRPLYVDCVFKNCVFTGNDDQPSASLRWSDVFRHCTFIDCTFRDLWFPSERGTSSSRDVITCDFTNCDFTGFFLKTWWDLSRAHFEGCKADYVWIGTQEYNCGFSRAVNAGGSIDTIQLESDAVKAYLDDVLQISGKTAAQISHEDFDAIKDPESLFRDCTLTRILCSTHVFVPSGTCIPINLTPYHIDVFLEAADERAAEEEDSAENVDETEPTS